MNPLPVEALPVVEILRRDVPRPPVDPQRRGDGFRWPAASGECCPIGLHAKAPCGAPDDIQVESFIDVEFAAAAAFINWWDGLKTLEDARQAVDLIWPRAEEAT